MDFGRDKALNHPVMLNDSEASSSTCLFALYSEEDFSLCSNDNAFNQLKTTPSCKALS